MREQVARTGIEDEEMRRTMKRLLALVAVIGVLGCSRPSAPDPGEQQRRPEPPVRVVEKAPALPTAEAVLPVEEAPVAQPGSNPGTEVAPAVRVLSATERAQLCGAFRDLRARPFSKGVFRLSRRELEASVNRFASEELLRSYRGQPLPAKTQSGEVGFAMLRVGPKASCGLKNKDYLVRVNGKLLSNPAERLEVRELIRSQRELVVEIERAKKRLTLRYVLED